MLHYERMVLDRDLICGILDMCDTLYIALNDPDNYPYVVPMNFGYEATEEALLFFFHCHPTGLKSDLWNRDSRCCVSCSRFLNLAEHPYKGHLHDYRSVIAKGDIRLIDRKEETALFSHAMQKLLVHNGRKPTHFNPARVPLLDMYVITCPWSMVTGKTEWPVRTVDDLPFADMHTLPQDNTPFDVSDLEEKYRYLK